MDELMVGFGMEGFKCMIGFFDELWWEVLILLVEYDMDVVFVLVDWISVLVYGKVIVIGMVDEIWLNKDVCEVYLGDEV